MVLNLHCRTCGRPTDIQVTPGGYMDDDLCGWCRAREADLATDAEYDRATALEDLVREMT